jgi:fatty-acyl-CoA synthase
MRILATTLIVRRPPTHRDKPPSGGVGRRPVILNRSGSQLEGWKIGRCDPSGPAAARRLASRRGKQRPFWCRRGLSFSSKPEMHGSSAIRNIWRFSKGTARRGLTGMIYQRLSSELAYLSGPLRALRRTKPIAKNPLHTVRELAEELADRFGDKMALESLRESYSYRQWNGRSNRYARWFRDQRLGKGDVVGLLMPNRAEYLCVWMGVAKAGGVTALLNTGLNGLSLAHCIDVVNAKVIVVDAAMLAHFETARHLLAADIKVFVHGDCASNDPSIVAMLDRFSDENLAADERIPLTIEDKCIFIFTSGTTGLPKAANLNHFRVLLMMHGFAGVTASTANDRMFDCLPMYHSNGGVVAPGTVLTVGGTCVIRERFSATEFWMDVVKSDCTMFIYIGELCRYLINIPAGQFDALHRVRLCVGNGLRPDIWPHFQERFRLRKIIEFYGSTEGNVSLFNFDSKPGAVGRIPKWAKRLFVVKVVKFDVATERPVLNEAGFCIECGPNEIGEVIGEVLNDPGKPANRFEGYADAAATEKKILHNAFKPGDAWFRSGDLMRRDGQGYFYFIDRIGDTYRWKGENVATSEVSEVITAFEGIREATVYGIAIPGADGRAGMAAIVADNAGKFDFKAFREHLARNLPDYALPVVLRFQSQLPVTSTFKQRKIDLVTAGFDPRRSADPLYFNDPRTQSFRPLDQASYEAIISGTVRL